MKKRRRRRKGRTTVFSTFSKLYQGTWHERKSIRERGKRREREIEEQAVLILMRRGIENGRNIIRKKEGTKRRKKRRRKRKHKQRAE